MGIVAGGQAEEGDLIVARALYQLLRLGEEGLFAPLPNGPVDVPRLAEPTAPGAAPHDLQRHPVVDDLHVGHQLTAHEGGLVQVFKDPANHLLRGLVREPTNGLEAVLVVFRLVEGGHVDAGDGGQPLQKLPLRLPRRPGGSVGVHQLRLRLLPVADDHGVEEGGDGLRVHGAGAVTAQGPPATNRGYSSPRSRLKKGM